MNRKAELKGAANIRKRYWNFFNCKLVSLFYRVPLISKRFIKTSFIYTLAGALPMASAVILLPFYMLYLPTSVYGALSLYLAFSIFVQIVVTYSFDSATYIYYHEYKHDKPVLASFISSAFVLILLLAAGSGILFTVAGDIIFRLIFDEDSKISFFPYGLLSVGIGAFQAIFKVYCNILQSSERPILFFRSNLLQFLLIVFLTFSGLYFFPNSLLGPIGGRLLAAILLAGWSLFRVFSHYGFHFNTNLLRSTFSFNQYTFIHQLQQWGINYLDRFIILLFLPLSTVGIYDFAIKCLVAIELILNGLHNSFYPKVVSVITAQSDKGSTVELNRYYNGMTAVILLIVSLSIFSIPLLFDLFGIKKGYEAAVAFIPYLAIVYVLRSVRYYFAIPFGVIKYMKPLPVISFFVSVIKVGLILLLIGDFGINGVIMATLASLIIEIVLMREAIRKRFTFRYNFFKLIAVPGSIILMVLVLEPFVSDQYKLLTHAAYVVLTATLLLWVYRNELKLIKFRLR